MLKSGRFLAFGLLTICVARSHVIAAPPRQQNLLASPVSSVTPSAESRTTPVAATNEEVPLPRYRVSKVVETGFMPKGVVVSHDATFAVVTNFGSLNRDNVRVYDLPDLTVRFQIDFRGNAVESVVSADNRTIYVSNFSENAIEVIDVATHQVISHIKTGQHPKVLTLSTDGKKLYSANWGTNDVTVISTESQSVLSTLKVGRQPRGMAEANGTLYVADFWDDKLHVFRNEEPIKTLPFCTRPRHLALNPAGDTLFASCLLGSQLSATSTASFESTFRAPTGTAPKSIAFAGNYVFTANFVGNSVSVVDVRSGKSRTQTIPKIREACGIDAYAEGAQVLVTGWLDGHLYHLEKLP
jgi:YVTN family beta-propeller protein